MLGVMLGAPFGVMFGAATGAGGPAGAAGAAGGAERTGADPLSAGPRAAAAWPLAAIAASVERTGVAPIR
jgi:hypothetical protein